MARLGDTFIFTNPVINNHLIIIISDPAQDPNRIVTANFTSWKADKDQSCIVVCGDHRYIKHKSCVDYRRDRLIRLSDYEKYINSNMLIQHDQISDTLIHRILYGAQVSPFIPFGNRQILVEQNLINDE